MYTHVFWDLGGTLVDTYPALDAAFTEVIRRHGHRVQAAEVAALTRRSTGEAVSALSERFAVPEEEFRAANDKLKRRWATSPAPAMAGARELLGDISAAGGLNLVVTHRDRASAQSLLRGLGLEVDDLVSTSDGFNRKPHPEMYRVMLQRHALNPTECLAVGDRDIDSKAATSSGIAAATLVSSEAPVDGGAKYTVARLDELRPLLALG